MVAGLFGKLKGNHTELSQAEWKVAMMGLALIAGQPARPIATSPAANAASAASPRASDAADEADPAIGTALPFIVAAFVSGFALLALSLAVQVCRRRR